MKPKLVIKKIYSLTPMQQGMLFHYLLDKKEHSYFEQISMDITGKLDMKMLEQAFNGLIEKYDIFRTIFKIDKVKEPIQIVLKERKATIGYVDLSNYSEAQQKEKINILKKEDIDRGFDLSKDILMRMCVYKLGEEKYSLVWSYHHILMDGWCLGIVMQDMFINYKNLQAHQSIDVNEIYPYSSYIEWIKKKDNTQALNYWREYLRGYEKAYKLPQNVSSGVDVKRHIEESDLVINQQLTSKLEDISKKAGVTLNNLLQGIWGILLKNYYHSDEVVFGVVVSGRPSTLVGSEQMVGLFINTLPMYIQFKKNETFIEMIKRVQSIQTEIIEYSYLPLADIQAQSMLNSELFDHIMVVENYPIEEGIKNLSKYQKLGLTIDNMEFFEETTYDFNLVVYPSDTITVRLSYNDKLFDEDFIARLKLHFENIVKQIVKNPNSIADNIEAITEEEKQQILNTFNATQLKYNKEALIQQLIEAQVLQTPDVIALKFNEQTLTYKELKLRQII